MCLNGESKQTFRRLANRRLVIMKTLIAVFVVLMLNSFANGQTRSCCSLPENKMAAFVSDELFRKAHAEPLPFTDPAPTGEWITFKCLDGKEGKAFVTNMKKDPKNIIFMFHEWWGLNDYVKAEAERISKTHDVMVVALDLYDGKVATTREDAGKYMQEMASSGRGVAITDGAFDYFPIEAHYITIGWCLGGSWSMKAALLPEDKRVTGCVIYYGMPETNADVLKNLHASILGIFAKKDKWITPEVVSNFEVAMTKAKKNLTLRTYDADHGFANPSNPNHDKAAKEDASKHVDEFIKKRFAL